jgi:DNA-binding CsgD family transcriptional regulator
MQELRQVVQERVGRALPRPLLAEVHETSGGNPFFALEIVRALVREGAFVEAARHLPVPQSLHEVVHDRLLALPDESRNFLAAAAAYAHPTIAITEAASGVAAAHGLGPALDAQIVEFDRERLRFTHPLLAAGAYEIADPARRRGIHARLAELLVDPEARAWQLAASVDEPDEAVAAALELAAGHARRRGGLRPAALLLDRSHDLTPADDRAAALRRGAESAYLHFEAGDGQRAEAQLRRLIAPLDPGLQRARALWMLARIRTYEAPAEAAELFLSVVEEADGDRELLAAAHEGVASSLYYALERLEEVVQHADVALGLARELGDRALEGDILVSKVGAQALLGDPAARSTADEAQVLQAETADRRILDQPMLAVGEFQLLIDAHENARQMFRELLEQVDDSGEESARPYLYCFLGQAELALGRLAEGLECAADGRVAGEQSGEALFAGYNRAVEALAHAQLGNAVNARSTARRSLAEARSSFELLVAAAALGHVELADGTPAVAVRALEPALQLARREKIAEPSAVRFAVDLIEALVELGRSDEATAILDWYGGNAQRLERVSALANCARCRGLLAAQSGDLDAALHAFDEALAWHEHAAIPLDRGRTLLALGAAQRRLKRRREARATLEEALGIFERIGAALWAERARGELKRISGRAATPGALTPAEERVALLVAEGKTNKEVAAALYLSDRTVEGHLARIFGKLGIRHRAELAAALQTRGTGSSNTGDTPVSAEPSAP